MRCVRHDAAGDLDVPRTSGVAGQELAADGVAHVVGQQGEPGEPRRGDHALNDVRLQRDRVRRIRLRGEAAADHVHQHDPAASREGGQLPLAGASM